MVIKVSTILCDGSIIDDIIDEFGTLITLIDVSTTHDVDEYHEPIEAETEYVITALIETVTSDEDRVREGLFQTGDLYVHFKSTEQDNVEIGNYVIYANDKYKIVGVDKGQSSDVVYIKGARASIYQSNIE